ncbi:MAG: transposase [Gaiellaceae bacterium]
MVDDRLVRVGDRGFCAALAWARGLGSERVWALEDCRHVSGAFERFLLVRGERVVRVATRMMAGERRGGRERGKSDLIDAVAVARAALREGIERLPVAELAGVELDIRLLVDHRERLVRMRTALNNDLLWHLLTSGPIRRCRAARCSRASGSRAWRGAWRATNRAPGSGSPGTSCARCASSHAPSTR